MNGPALSRHQLPMPDGSSLPPPVQPVHLPHAPPNMQGSASVPSFPPPHMSASASVPSFPPPHMQGSASVPSFPPHMQGSASVPSFPPLHLNASASIPSFPTVAPTHLTPRAHNVHFSPRPHAVHFSPRVRSASPFPRQMLAPRALAPRVVAPPNLHASQTPRKVALVQLPPPPLRAMTPRRLLMVPSPHAASAQSFGAFSVVSPRHAHHLRRLVEAIRKAAARKTSDAFECLWRSRWSWNNVRSGHMLDRALESQRHAANRDDYLLRVLLGLRILQRTMEREDLLLHVGFVKLLQNCRQHTLPASHYLVSRSSPRSSSRSNSPRPYLVTRPEPQNSRLHAAAPFAASIDGRDGSELVSEERETPRSAPSNTSSPRPTIFKAPPGRWTAYLDVQSRSETARDVNIVRLPHAPEQLPKRPLERSFEHHSAETYSMPVPESEPTEFRPSLSATGPVPVRSTRLSSVQQKDSFRREADGSHPHPVHFFEEAPEAPMSQRQRSVTVMSHAKKDEIPVDVDNDDSSDSGEWWDNHRATIASRASHAAGGTAPARLRAGTTLHDKLDHKEVENRRTVAARALGVDKDASRQTVVKAYHERARLYHPDKGGYADDFKLVNVAYNKMKVVQ